LDEIELGGSRPELQNEVLDLALAYNFATPFTAFLAIPESELDWQSARQIASARAYKAELFRRKPDAAHVAGSAGPGPSASEENRLQSSERFDKAAADDAHESMQERRRERLAQNSPPAESEENPLEEASARPKYKLGSSGARREPGGCSSCSVSGTDDATL